METSDLAVCRSVRYTKGPRKRAKKCKECGFYFVPDDQKYLVEDSIPVEYMTGIEWYEKHQCCPNCLPKQIGAPYGQRRCIGSAYWIEVGHFTKWAWHTDGNILKWVQTQGCGYFFPVTTKNELRYEGRIYNQIPRRKQICNICNPSAGRRRHEAYSFLVSYGKKALAHLGYGPSTAEWNRLNPTVPSHYILQYFDTWERYLDLFGFSPPFGRRFNRNSLLKKLQVVAHKYGRALCIREWKEHHLRPSVSVLKRSFGSFTKAWLAAGIAPYQQTEEYKAILRERVAIFRPQQFPSPTARDLWLATHGQASPETQAYLDAVEHHTKQLEEAERIFEEHKFKRR